jgi:hypothetical protein
MLWMFLLIVERFAHLCMVVPTTLFSSSVGCAEFARTRALHPLYGGLQKRQRKSFAVNFGDADRRARARSGRSGCLGLLECGSRRAVNVMVRTSAADRHPWQSEAAKLAAGDPGIVLRKVLREAGRGDARGLHSGSGRGCEVGHAEAPEGPRGSAARRASVPFWRANSDRAIPRAAEGDAVDFALHWRLARLDLPPRDARCIGLHALVAMGGGRRVDAGGCARALAGRWAAA